ncbi:DUF3043 domain-containing protein [Georgenia sp. Z1491]|uniref:DUF3043 domain-containing protein n=1 Tax=Georgenia sp. Z1491 TaxID=3416707 RepID=UPI003CEB7FA3
MRVRRTDASPEAPEHSEGADDLAADERSAPGATPRKGRPTPTKAEAAARNRQPLVVNDRKAARKRAKEQRNKNFALQQQAMRTGDERYLPARDRGPVRRAARDWIDSRFLPSQIFLPGAFVIMLAMLVVGQFLPGYEAAIVMAMYLLLVLSIITSVIAVLILKRRLVAEHGDRYVKGTVWYAFIRSMYPRFLRQPKPQVRIGGGPVQPRQ